MGREVGWGFRMVNRCTPVADSCQCMAKLIQYCKVKKKKKKQHRREKNSMRQKKGHILRGKRLVFKSYANLTGVANVLGI